MDVVSQVLSVRRRDAGGLERMLGASLLAHLVLVTIALLAPGAWQGGSAPPAEEARMVISLGGPPGPRTGLTTMGGRPIQTEAVEAKRAIEPVRPPAAREPEMIEPKKAAPKRTETRAAAPPPKTPTSRTPTRGEEVRPGTSVTETGARGMGFGLSAGGGGTSGQLDVANFCCPEYLSMMLDMINQRWDAKQQTSGVTVVKFVIERDGTLTNIEVERSSGNAALDLFARRALIMIRQLPPLPAAFTQPRLTVHLAFEYQR